MLNKELIILPRGSIINKIKETDFFIICNNKMADESLVIFKSLPQALKEYLIVDYVGHQYERTYEIINQNLYPHQPNYNNAILNEIGKWLGGLLKNIKSTMRLYINNQCSSIIKVRNVKLLFDDELIYNQFIPNNSLQVSFRTDLFTDNDEDIYNNDLYQFHENVKKQICEIILSMDKEQYYNLRIDNSFLRECLIQIKKDYFFKNKTKLVPYEDHTEAWGVSRESPHSDKINKLLSQYHILGSLVNILDNRTIKYLKVELTCDPLPELNTKEIHLDLFKDKAWVLTKHDESNKNSYYHQSCSLSCVLAKEYDK
jgi:hypothetical protein